MLLRLGEHTGEGVKQLSYTTPSFAKLLMFGVNAVLSPYGLKNSDWSSHTSQIIFGFCWALLMLPIVIIRVDNNILQINRLIFFKFISINIYFL